MKNYTILVHFPGNLINSLILIRTVFEILDLVTFASIIYKSKHRNGRFSINGTAEAPNQYIII